MPTGTCKSPLGNCSAPVAVTRSLSPTWMGRPGSSDHCASLCLSYTRQPLSPCPVCACSASWESHQHPLPRGNETSGCHPGAAGMASTAGGQDARGADGGGALDSKGLPFSPAGPWAQPPRSRLPTEAEARATESGRSREPGIVSEEERKRKTRHPEGP